jgi:hypothetical protein
MSPWSSSGRCRKPEDIHDLGKIRKSETRSREDVTTPRSARTPSARSTAPASPERQPDSLVDIIENRDAGTDGDGEIARRVL